MPMMQYLSVNKPVLMSEWQGWAIIGVAIAGIVAVIVAFWEVRKL